MGRPATEGTRARNSCSDNDDAFRVGYLGSQSRDDCEELGSRVSRAAWESACRPPFTIDELRAVQADVHALVQDKAAADMILVLGLTGLRWGEIAALRVRDVRTVPFRAFRVSRSRPDGQRVRSVKRGKPRTLPLLDDAWKVVQPLSDRGPDEVLFANQLTAPRQGPSRARPPPLGGNDVDPERCRHRTIQNWLGHASAKLTLDTAPHYLGTNADIASIALMNTALSPNGGTRGVRAQKAGNDKVV